VPGSGPADASKLTPVSYAERLIVPLWWWFVAAFLVTLLGAEFHVGLPLAVKVITYLVFGGTAAFLLLFAGAVQVAVRNGTLIAGRATLPLQYAGEIRILDRPAIRALMGPETDPAAWTVTRPWVKDGVAVVVEDPADDTPYWLISSRRPQELAAAIAAARPPPAPTGPSGTPPEPGP
jgi:Protein of unknown function (DUF3093)